MREDTFNKLKEYIVSEGMRADTISVDGLTHEFFKRIVVDRDLVPIRNQDGQVVTVKEYWPVHMREKLYEILNNN